MRTICRQLNQGWLCIFVSVYIQIKSFQETVFAYFCPFPASLAGYEPERGEAAASEGKRHYDQKRDGLPVPPHF